MNTLSAIVTAALAALAADLGTFDLSATDQVKEGAYDRPPGSVAFACITPPELSSSEPQAQDAWYLETYTCEVRLWVPFTADTTGNRSARGRLVADEAKAALDLARAAGGALFKCVTYRCESTVPEPGATTSTSWVNAVLTLEFSFRRLAGTGA